MPNILVRDVPDEVHARLQARAATRGISLQRLLAEALEEVAQRADIAEAVARWESMARSRDPHADTAWVPDDLVSLRESRAAQVDAVVDDARR